MVRKTDEEKILGGLREMNSRISELVEKVGLDGDVSKYSDEIARLKKDLTDKQILWDREQEKWDREKREVEHQVGLHKKQMEAEKKIQDTEHASRVGAATKEAELRIREQHITAKEDLFEEKMRAVTDTLKEHIDYLRTDIVKELMTRLPIFNVDTTLQPHGPRVIENK